MMAWKAGPDEGRPTLGLRGAIAALVVLAPLAGPAWAQATGSVTPVETADDWKVMRGGKDKQKFCYIYSPPKAREPKPLQRGDGHAFVTTRLEDGTRNEIGIVLGFAGKAGADGTLKIGNASFPMRPDGESGFLKNPADQPKVLDALRKGADMSVIFTSGRGNVSTDKYSLKGFGKALDRMAKECP